MADKKKSRRGVSQKNLHLNLNHDQGESLSFSLVDRIPYRADKYRYSRVSHEYEWEKHVHMLDKMIRMNHEDLLTAHEISKELEISVDTIHNLFEAKDVELLKSKEIGKRRRERDFDFLYNAHFNKKLSLNEIYRQFGFSPPYVKRVFSDKGIGHMEFSNQHKKDHS